MDVNTILLIVNLIISTVSPIIIAGASCLKRIRHSECCMGKIDIDPESAALQLNKKASSPALADQSKK